MKVKKSTKKSKGVRTTVARKSKNQKPVKGEVLEESIEASQEEFVETPLDLQEGAGKGSSKPVEKTHRGRSAPVSTMSDVQDFTVQTHFDKHQKQFVGTVLEFPEIRVTGYTREEVLFDIETQIEDAILVTKKRGGEIPQPIQTRQYPSKLEVSLSQGLFRRLDLLSRKERVALDQLVVELISGAIAQRSEGGRALRQPQSHSQGRGEGNHRRSDGGHRRSNRQRGNFNKGGNHQRRRNTGGGNQSTDSSGEAFIDYVRKLEKREWRA